MRKVLPVLEFLCFYLMMFSGSELSAQTPVYLDPTKPVDERVNDLMSRMTLDEKIGQMMQVDQSEVDTKLNDIATYSFGSILSGGNSDPAKGNLPINWTDLYDTLQTYSLKSRLKIPMIYGIDAVHGNNNVIGATIFPHNIGLGCTRNPELVKEAARFTALEIAATGVDWTFAPCIAVTRDERWGRTYEGFGETPELAEILGAAAVKGFQGDSLTSSSILACSKHYLGDGGTLNGDDQGNCIDDETTIRNLFLPGYITAIDSNVGSIMASFNSINGTKMHGNKYWLTDVLKNELGFKGIIVSDWAGVDQVNSNYKTAVELSINAGIDMVMLPYRYGEFLNNMKSLISEGKISTERVDDAVKRILTIKFKMGLFENPFADRSLLPLIGSVEHRAVARQCVRESMVLLKRKDNVLPIPKSNVKIYLAGDHVDNLGDQCGGWTIDWQGGKGDITNGTTFLEAMEKAAPAADIQYSQIGDFPSGSADYSIVVIGEEPYAEGYGDATDLSIKKSDVELIKKMKSYGCPVIVILFSGRPMIVEQILHYTDALIAAWLPGTEGEGITDVLFGDYNPKGLLSNSWPVSMDQIPINVGDADYHPLYEYGYGITSFDNSLAGSVPILLSGIVTTDGKHVELSFNKDMKDPSTANGQFSFTVNNNNYTTGINASVSRIDNTTLVLELDNSFNPRDTITINYLSGNIQSEDNGTLQPFNSFKLYNWTTPAAVTIPGIIEAENYSDMFGVVTEPTSDSYGVFQLSGIDDGDWIEYIINVTQANNYYLNLRVASANSQGKITLSSCNRILGSRTISSTGGLQTWATIKQVIGLTAGEQVLKVAATKGGFNLNWLSIQNISTSVEDNPIIPLTNKLEQNHPNPFNPSTAITYHLSSAGKVNLKIFNMLGEEVETLVDEFQPAGSYTKIFSANSTLSSGIYFYRLQTNSFTDTKKLIMLK